VQLERRGQVIPQAVQALDVGCIKSVRFFGGEDDRGKGTVAELDGYAEIIGMPMADQFGIDRVRVFP
jgi:hypothetical protein